MTNQDPDLECRHVVELVTDYLEGALPTENAERLEQHLLICDACTTFVDQHRSVISALSHIVDREPEPAAAEGARSAALQLFRRMRKGEDPGSEQS